jgi:hypothetical protein
MSVEHNERNEFAGQEMTEFEERLRGAMRRQAAPVGLKTRVLAQSRERRREARRSWLWMWQRVTAVLVVAAAVGGAVEYRHVEEVRKGEEARQQVMTALRITGKTLNRVQARLAE